MTAIAFDTHCFVKKLKAAGFAEEQAEVFAGEQTRLIEDKLATKNELVELESHFRRDLKELEYRIIKLGGLMAASIAIVATLVKLL